SESDRLPSSCKSAAKCQKRTFALQQKAATRGAGEQSRRHFEAERIGSREINEEIEFGRLLDRELGWLRSAQNLIDQVGSSAPHVLPVRSIGHQTSHFHRLPYNVHRR